MQRHPTFIVGFAIFAMFFGSGNLVFPLEIGYASGSYWLIGYLGLFLTGIGLPFLGMFVIKRFNGDYYAFFGQAGDTARWFLPLLTLSLLGSFGVIPRCITVAYSGLHYCCPQLSLWVFSFIFCSIVFFICLKEQIMMKALGKWMSPLLLSALFLLIFAGIIYAPSAPTIDNATHTFFNGFITGYQTMDLFAAFFFSALVFAYVQAAIDSNDQSTIMRAAIKPSLFGAALLAIIYLGLVLLGAKYHALLTGVAPQLMLPTIAQHVLGQTAALLIALTIILSCLSTAVALNNIYANYLFHQAQLDASKLVWVLLATTATAFFISLLDFNGITKWLVPVLKITYPGLIALTCLCIINKEYIHVKRIVFYGFSCLVLMNMGYSLL